MDNNQFTRLQFNLKEKICLFVSFVAILFTFAYVLYVWDKLPEYIPKHYNELGIVDSLSKKSSLIVLPVISFILFMFMTILSFFPQIYNYPVKITMENKLRQYHNSRELILYLSVEIQLAFSYISYRTIGIALKEYQSLSILFLPVFLVILTITMIFKMYKIYKLK